VDPVPTANAALLEVRASYDAMPHTITVTKRLFPDDRKQNAGLTSTKPEPLNSRRFSMLPPRRFTHTVARRHSRRLRLLSSIRGSGIHHIFIGPDHILFILA